MRKNILCFILCISVISIFSAAYAHDSFTWFGLKKNDTEVVLKTSDSHSVRSHHKHRDCFFCFGDHKPKQPHKHKPKHKHKPQPKHKPPCPKKP